MRFFYYLYCIVFFAICVILAMLLDFYLWCSKMAKRVCACIKKLFKRAYWWILRHSGRSKGRSR